MKIKDVKEQLLPSGPGSDLIDVSTWLWQCGQVKVIGFFPYFIGPWTITICCAGCCTGWGPVTYTGACIGGACPGSWGYTPKVRKIASCYLYFMSTVKPILTKCQVNFIRLLPAGGGAYDGAAPGYGGGGSFIFGGALASWDLFIFILFHLSFEWHKT